MFELSGLVAFALFALISMAPDPALANCNLIPATLREFRSVQGNLDRAILAPGSPIAVRVDLACDPTAPGFATDAASNRVFLRFVPPGSGADPALVTEVEIPAADLTPANCSSQRCDTLIVMTPPAGVTHPSFPYPLTGPVEIRVENLANQVIARVGPLFEPTLGCDDQQPESVFGHLTAIPPANDFGALVSGADTTVEATLDGNGNLLIPVDYTAVLPAGPGSAVFRILEASADLDAFSNAPGVPIAIPASRYLRSFNLAGRPIPPVLEATGNGETIFGSVDARFSIVRIARSDPDAPSPPIYDLSDRLQDGRGPIVIANASADARESAPLSTLSADPNAITFARLEGIEGDLNGDGDAFDRVPQVIDVASGAGASTALAVAEITVPGFGRPILASGDGFVAFGVAEGRQGYAPLNGDGDVMDSLLRVFSATGDSLTSGATTVSPDPVVNGKPLVISNGLAFFRTREGDAAPRVTEAVTPTLENTHARADSTDPALSRDGRIVAFRSAGGATFGAGLPSGPHVFVYDRQTGAYELIDRDANGDPVDDGLPVGPVAVSADGRLVLYAHRSQLLPGADADSPGAPDIFVYDRQTQTTTCASCALPNGEFPYVVQGASDDGRYVLVEADHARLDRQTGDLLSVLAIDEGYPDLELVPVAGERASISGDGRYVALRCELRVVPNGSTVADLLFRFDMDGHSVSFGPPGSTPSMNADGSLVSLMSDEDLVGDDTNLATDVYVWDVAANQADWISLDTNGQGGSGGLIPRASAISDDGRFVAYINDSDHEVPGLGGASRQTYRVDRSTNVIEAVSVSTAGDPANAFSNQLAISGDGQSVAISGSFTNLAPDLFDLVQHIVVRGDTGAASLNAADADDDDIVLQVFDTSAEATLPGVRVPASVVAVAAGRAVILSSEADDGGVDRNGDGDAEDRVARVVDGLAGAVVETGLAASGVAISEEVACIAVDEAAHEAGDLNGNGSEDDHVLFVRVLESGDTSNAGVAVDPARLDATGSRCVFASEERRDPGSPDLNGDGDDADAVLRVYDAATAIPTTWPYAVEDLVAQGDVVAFRVCENAQGQSDLNFDGDAGGDYDECVMHVLDLASSDVQNTERAAVACDLPGCDPFFEPYRVTPSAVSFLMTEYQQSGQGVPQGAPLAVDCTPTQWPGGCDLSGDGDENDAMIAVYNLRADVAQLLPLSKSTQQSSAPPFPTEVGDSGVLYIEVFETEIGEDVNGDGEITPVPVLVLVGDADGDGTLDDAVNRNDSCVETPNPDQADADRDRLGDDACDPAPTQALPGDVTCDVDSNGQIDKVDAEIVFGDRGTAARASDPRDPDLDGQITVLDVSECRSRCTYASCRVGPPQGGCGIGAEIALALAGLTLLRRRMR